MAKNNAPQILHRELSHVKTNEIISIGNATDPYQPIEAKLHITRKIIEVLSNLNLPFDLITKSSLIKKDFDLLRGINNSRVCISLFSMDKKLSRIFEPIAPSPTERIKTVKSLISIGFPVYVHIAPIINSVNDDLNQLEEMICRLSEIGVKYLTFEELFVTKTIHESIRDRAGIEIKLKRELPDGRFHLLETENTAEISYIEYLLNNLSKLGCSLKLSEITLKGLTKLCKQYNITIGRPPITN